MNGITVNDDIRIIGGGQNDSYLLTDVESGGRLFATGGGGDDHILVQGSRFVETTMITGGGQDFVGWVDSRLPGRGRYILGTGLDGFVMADSAIAGEVYLNTGPQEDAVYFNNTTIRTELDVLLGSFDDTLVFAEGSTLPGDTVIRPLGVRNADKLVMDESVRVRNDIIDSFGNSFVEDNDVLGRFELAVGLPVDFLVDTFKARGFSQADFPLDIPADDYATYYPNAERWQFSSELHGEIERGYDFDWQLVRLNQGERYTFETFAGTLDKTRLQLYDRDGVQVAIDSDGGVGKLSKLTYRATYTGVYYLGVSSNVDFVGTYTVRRV